MHRVRSALFASMLSAVLATGPLYAQEAQAPGSTPATQKLSKDQKKKVRRGLKELEGPYKQWLSEDVIYIISPEERTAFLQLETNEEREQFIEQFWLRRSGNHDL